MALASNQRLLITGGRGRLAGTLNAHFEQSGLSPLCVSRAAGDRFLGLENIFVNNLLDQTDTVLHLAWSTLPASSERHVGLEWKEDLPLLIRLLQHMVDGGMQSRLHFIFFSSGGAVYGPAQDQRPSCEDDVCRPVGWYGHAKLAAEKIIEEYGRRHGLSYTILRISNPYGFTVPYFKAQGIIPFLIKSAQTSQPFHIWGDGTARKDFLHIADLLAALERVVETRPQGIYNLSYGKSHRINEVIDMVATATGRSIATIEQPPHQWDVQTSLLDNRRLSKALDWQPTVSLTEGISMMLS